MTLNHQKKEEHEKGHWIFLAKLEGYFILSGSCGPELWTSVLEKGLQCLRRETGRLVHTTSQAPGEVLAFIAGESDIF